MEAEDLVFNDCAEWEVIEKVGQEFPNISVAILAHTFIIKAVNLSDLAAFVVSSQNRDSISKAHFQTNQQSDRLHRVVTSIHIITHEEVISIGAFTSNLEQLNQIVELTMNITADSDWTAHKLHV